MSARPLGPAYHTGESELAGRETKGLGRLVFDHHRSAGSGERELPVRPALCVSLSLGSPGTDFR